MGPVWGRALVGRLGLGLGLGVPTGLPGVPLPFSPPHHSYQKISKRPSMGAHGSQANQGGGGIPTELRQHKKDYTGDWMGRGGRKSFSFASPRRVGSHTNQGTVKGPGRRAHGSLPNQGGGGTPTEIRRHKKEYTVKKPGRGARGSLANQGGGGIPTELRQHKKDYTGDWMGRGGRNSLSHGTVKRPGWGARGSRPNQGGGGIPTELRQHK